VTRKGQSVMGWEPKGEIALICFTREGARLGRRILEGLKEDGTSCRGYVKASFLSVPGEQDQGTGLVAGPKAVASGVGGPVAGPEAVAAEAGGPIAGPEAVAAEADGLTAVEEPLSVWTKEQFEKAEGLIFVGALGIAVRAAAPCVKDKFGDPALVVVDEKGTFAIPVLSGHMGGANDLARRIGEKLGATPVITTATDIQGKFAVDVAARKMGLWISSREKAKQVSADLLEGRPVGFFSDFPVEGGLPEGCVPGPGARSDIAFTIYRQPDRLCLVPKILTLGIGCRKSISFGALRAEVMDCLTRERLFPQAVCQVATIDIKKEEKALSRLCEEMGWAFCCFSAEELRSLEGSFSHSDFVEETVGVGNVCERAAVLGSRGALVLKKQRLEAVTLAAAIAPWQVAL